MTTKTITDTTELYADFVREKKYIKTLIKTN